VPVRKPFAVGVKVTFIVQVPPAGATVEQLFWTAKSPVAVAFETLSAALPKLTIVTASGLLAVPIGSVLSANAAGVRAAAGAFVGAIFKMNASDAPQRRQGIAAPGSGCNALNTGNGGVSPSLVAKPAA
jgi:hypothetical protein